MSPGYRPIDIDAAWPAAGDEQMKDLTLGPPISTFAPLGTSAGISATTSSAALRLDMLPEDRIRLQHMLDATQTAIGYFNIDTEVVWRTVKSELPEPAKVVAKTRGLMHPFMQYRHDADVAVRQTSPIDEMALVAKVEPLDAEIRRDRARRHLVSVDALEGVEQAVDIAVRLLNPPAVPRIAIDFVKSIGRSFLDADLRHRNQALLRAITSPAVRRV